MPAGVAVADFGGDEGESGGREKGAWFKDGCAEAGEAGCGGGDGGGHCCGWKRGDGGVEVVVELRERV